MKTFSRILLTTVFLFLLLATAFPAKALIVEIYPSQSQTGSDSTGPLGETGSSYAGQTITIPAGVTALSYINFDNVWVGNNWTTQCCLYSNDSIAPCATDGTTYECLGAGVQVGMNAEIRVYKGVRSPQSGTLPTTNTANLIGSMPFKVPWSGAAPSLAYAYFSPFIPVNPGDTIYFELYSTDNLAARDNVILKVPLSSSNPFSGGLAYYDVATRYLLTAHPTQDLAQVRVYGSQEPPTDNATCGTLSSDSPIYPDQTFKAIMSMSNTGNTPWPQSANYFLKSQNDFSWGVTSMRPDYDVPAGTVARFTATNFKAPSTPGTYNFKWQMANDTIWFGELCTFQVTVSSPSGANLSTLNINIDPATGAVALPGGSYRVSGLRSDQGGQNHYNGLLVTQRFSNATSSNVYLEGMAFTSQSSPPAGGCTSSNNCLYELTRSAYLAKGPMLIYAVQNQSANYYNGSNTSSQTFNIGNYYVYFNGNWSGAMSIGSLPYGSSALGIRVSVTNASNPPMAPQFSVTFYQTLANRSWQTYGYIMRNDATSSEAITNQTPLP